MKKISFFYTGLVYGGGERTTFDIARGLRNMGHDVELVFLYKKERYKKLPDELPMHFLDQKNMRKGIDALAKYMRERKAHTILTTQEHAHIVSILARGRSCTDTKVVLRMGMPISRLFRYKNIKDRLIIPILSKKLFPKADKIISVSKEIKDELIDFGIEEDKISVIYNPLPKINTNKPAHKWLKEKTSFILAMGRMEEQKDFKTLIKAYAEVSDKIDSKLLILGDGSKRQELKKLSESLGIGDKVDMPGGYVENPIEYMKSADMFVLSSIYEGFPNVLTEAMYAGSPVIAADCISGPREILAPETNYKKQLKGGIEWAKYGVLFGVGDHHSLSEAIYTLTSDSQKKEEYIKLGKERSNDFLIGSILPLYNSVLLD